MKIVINVDFGGFGVSEAVYNELGFEWDDYGYLTNEDFGIESNNYYAYRSDSRLITAIEKIGTKKSSGFLAALKIIEVPDGIEWDIDNYDGLESIHENHQSWS